jgi:NADPH2:quinone reductase
MVKNLRWQFVLLYTVGDLALSEAVADISAAVEDGVLTVGEKSGLPLHRFSLADSGAAHQAVEDSVVGKVLIDVTAA